MKELIKAYLIHSGHYLAGKDIQRVREAMLDGEFAYIVNVLNPCLFNNVEEVYVTLSDLLVFLFERQA